MTRHLAVIPSPTTSVWFLGPLPLRAYALCIVLGLIVAIVISDRRLRARGGPRGAILDIAVWAVPFGMVGGRLYHVVTDWQLYFGPDSATGPIGVFYVWQGGLGIWGAVALGGVGAWIGARRLGLPFGPVADSIAVGLPIAQAIGRWGNWFNNELYGGPTALPWALRVHTMDPVTGRAVVGPDGLPVVVGLVHPTFLYESLWCLGVAALVWWADRRFVLGRGRAFALYVLGYTAGRVWIEALRTDFVNAVVGGVRLNVYVSVIVFLAALAYLLLVRGPREHLPPATDRPPRSHRAPTR